MPYTDMGRLTQEIGAVEALGWLAESKRVKIDFKFGTEQNWQDGLDDLVEDLDPYMTGRFMVMLGNEALLTDDTAEYVIHFDEDSDRDVISLRWFIKI